jgi:transaldolase
MEGLKIKLFADGANLTDMLRLQEEGLVQGFTTNPTLMRKAGVVDYTAFSREVLSLITTAPISLEVFADEFDEMYRQAMTIASWGENVWVKLPITNTAGDSSCELVKRVVAQGVKVNVTALLTLEQVREVAEVLDPAVQSIVSVFAGRIADTGRDPIPVMQQAVAELGHTGAEVLWASPREVLNIYQADQCGCHIVTVPADFLAKLSLRNKDLTQVSRETVQMFYNDASRAGYVI